MNSYKYPFDKILFVTNNTLELTPSTFTKKGIWEFDEIKHFYQKVFDNKKDKINIVDIGAQTGLYTLFAKFIDKAIFYAYEPIKECYDELNENIKLNSITNVKTFNIALSDHKMIKELKIPDQKGLSTFGDKPRRFNKYETIEVLCDTLDNLFYNTDTPIDFIKCDTEGWEYYILKGGLKSINKYKPIIQLEYNITNMNQCDIRPDIFNKYIEEIGYICTHKNEQEYIYEYNITN
jgi:FkbM family methyltransferase